MSKVIVISLDRWQAGFLGFYGNPWVDSPALDEFAVGAAVFDQHFAENLSGSARQHAWWTGRYQFPLTPIQQDREPMWLPLLAARGISSTLLYDPDSEIPLQPRQFASSKAVSVKDTAGLHFEEEAPQFVKTAVQRIRKMRGNLEHSELFWIHASGLPVDTYSQAYEDLYSDEPAGTVGLGTARSGKGRAQEDAGDFEADSDEMETAESGLSPEESDEEQSDTSADADEADADEEELIVFPPKFWRRNRSSPRELADASLRGAGWNTNPTNPSSTTTAADTTSSGTPSAVDWQLRRDLYSGQVTQWDAWIGKIIEAAQEVGQLTPVMIVFTAATGEHLGEHHDVSGATELYAESIQCPLAIQVPQTDPFAGRRLQLTTAADLPATILDWFQISVPQGSEIDGISLLPLIRDDRTSCRSMVLMGSDTYRGVRTSEFYLLQEIGQGASGESVYVKPDDRWDVDNMIRQLPDAAETLKAQGEALTNTIQTRSSLSETSGTIQS